MNELPTSSFQRAILVTHGAKARLLARELVSETFKGKIVWSGEVLIFELEGHASSRLCYAWEVDGKVMAVLHEPPVDSPQAAVRAAIVAGEKNLGDSNS